MRKNRILAKARERQEQKPGDRYKRVLVESWEEEVLLGPVPFKTKLFLGRVEKTTIEIVNPETGEKEEIESPVPEEIGMQLLLDCVLDPDTKRPLFESQEDWEEVLEGDMGTGIFLIELLVERLNSETVKAAKKP